MRRRFNWLPVCLPVLACMGTPMAAQAQYFRGVNIAGAEFGMSHLPGIFNTDYTYNSELTFRYFAARNLKPGPLPPAMGAAAAGPPRAARSAESVAAEECRWMGAGKRQPADPGNSQFRPLFVQRGRAAQSLCNRSAVRRRSPGVARRPGGPVGAALQRIRVRTGSLCIRPDERAARHGRAGRRSRRRS